MSFDPLQPRRASLDDLPALRSFWRATGVSDSAPEKRLTEFQLVTTQGGDLIACGGLQIGSNRNPCPGGPDCGTIPVDVVGKTRSEPWSRTGARIERRVA